jgi:hypothetical protein
MAMTTSNSKSLTTLRQLSDENLIQSLVMHTENSAEVRRIILERMAQVGARGVVQWLDRGGLALAATTTTAAGNGPHRIMFKDMVDAENLRETNTYLLKYSSDYWTDETIKQQWEVDDFLTKTMASNYYDMTAPMQNFYRRIINQHNRWYGENIR